MTIRKSRLQQAIRSVRDEICSAIRAELSDESRTYSDIAKENGVSIATVQRVAERAGISRKVGPRPRNTSESMEDSHEQ